MFSAFRTDFSTLFLKVSIPSWGRVKAKQGYSVAVWKNPNPGYSLLKSKRYMLRLFSQCLGKELKCRKFQLPLLFLQRLSSRSLKDNKLTQKPCISKRQKVQSCGYSTPHIFMIGENVSNMAVENIQSEPKSKFTSSQVQGHTMTLHIYIPQTMSLPSTDFLHLMISKM